MHADVENAFPNSEAIANEAPPAPRPESGRFAFVGSGLELLWIEVSNFVLSALTVGIASLLAISQWRLSRFWVTNTTLDGRPLRYEMSWGDEFGHQILTALLVLVTCGLATPWAVANAHRFRWSRASTADGRRVTMDGSLFMDGLVVGGLFLLVFLTFGLAVPVAYAWWRAYWTSQIRVEDPQVPGGWYRLRFDAGYLSLLIQWILNHALIALTFYLYVPWAVVNLAKFGWSATGDDQSPPLKVPAGPRTPAQWAVVVLYALSTVLLSVGILFVGIYIAQNKDKPTTSATSSSYVNSPSDAPAAPVRVPSESLPTQPPTPPPVALSSATHVVHNTASDLESPWLALRSAPDYRAGLLARLPDGTRVRLIRSEGSWEYVQVVDGSDRGKVGYARNRYLKKLATVESTSGTAADFAAPIPAERSKPPTVAEWSAAPKVDMQPDGCIRKIVREWLKLNCSKDDDNGLYPIAITRTEGMGGEGSGYFSWSKEGRVVDIVVAMRRGGRGTAIFELRGQTLVVGYDWRAGGDYPEIIWQ